MVVSQSDSTLEDQAVDPTALYKIDQFRELCGNKGWLSKRLSASLVVTIEDGRISGHDALDLMERLQGYEPLHRAVQKIYPQKKNAFQYHKEGVITTQIDRLTEAENPLPESVENWAAEGRPAFYVVKKNKLSSFKKFVESLPTVKRGRKSIMLRREVAGYVPPTSVKEGALAINVSEDSIAAAGLRTKLFAFYTYHGHGGGVFYALEPEEKMDFNAAQEIAATTLDFVKRWAEGFDLGVRTNAYFSPLNGNMYVVGMVAADTTGMANDLLNEFIRKGFQRIAVPSQHVKPLFDETVRQRRNLLPLIESARLRPDYSHVLETLLASR